jgi:hypothetical protein
MRCPSLRYDHHALLALCALSPGGDDSDGERQHFPSCTTAHRLLGIHKFIVEQMAGAPADRQL